MTNLTRTSLTFFSISTFPNLTILTLPVRHRRRCDDGERGCRPPGHPEIAGQDRAGQDPGQEDRSAARQGQEEAGRRNPG